MLIRAVKSEFSLGTISITKTAKLFMRTMKTDHIVRMPRLICGFFQYWSFLGRCSVAAHLCLCVCGFICSVCVVLFVPHFPSFDASAGITKTYLYNFDPLKPHFYIVKLGFAGVQVIFLSSAQNMDCGYSLEPPCRVGSNEYQQSMF